MEDQTAVELQGKLERKRKEAGTDARPQPTSASSQDSVHFHERKNAAPCPEGCGRTVTFPQTRIVGSERWMPRHPPRCDDCQAELERAKEKLQAKAERVRRKEAAAKRKKRLPELLDQVGVNVREHGRCTLDGFEGSPRLVEAARRFVDEALDADRWDPVKGIYVSGPTGTGKSHLAVAVVHELVLDPRIDPERDVVFDYVPWLIVRLQGTYGQGGPERIVQKRLNARVWVVDDLGAEKRTGDVATHLNALIGRRSLHPTLITSNYGAQELADAYPDFARVVSRLGPAYFEHFQLAGQDRRFSRGGA